MSTKDQLLLLKRGSSQSEAYAFFDSLPPMDSGGMTGLWRGSELPSGHPMDGLLTLVPWYGKCFRDAENVDPLVMQDRRGRLYRANPDSLLKYAEVMACLPIRAGSFDPHRFDPFLKLFRTGQSRARLRQLQHRGLTTAAMVYDHLEIIDVFRRVDEDTLLGVMDFKGKMHDTGYFFVLQRQAGGDAVWL